MPRETRDSVHTVKEGVNATFPEEAEAGSNCFLKALRLGWLGLVKQEGVEQKKELKKGKGRRLGDREEGLLRVRVRCRGSPFKR